MAPGMIHLNHQFLVEIGLGHLEGEQQEIILKRLYEVLEQRVGQVISSSLTRLELSTFERLVEEGDKEAAQKYLQEAVPDYGFVVRSELELISTSIVQSIRQGEVLVPAVEGVKESNA